MDNFLLGLIIGIGGMAIWLIPINTRLQIHVEDHLKALGKLMRRLQLTKYEWEGKHHTHLIQIKETEK